jgi:predicted acyl esterase
MRLLKWHDHYFAAQDGLEAFHRYAGAKKIYMGTRGHFSDAAESERLYQYDQVTRWLDHYLKNAANGIESDPMYTYAYSSLPMDTAGFFQWTRIESPAWPPAGIQNIRFYLSCDSALSYAPSTSPADSFLVKNDYKNPSYTFDIAYIEGFRGPSFDAALPKSTLVFKSGLLDNDVTWLGVPSMHLLVRSADAKFPLNAQIYEEDPAGNRFFVNRINYTARNWTSGAQGVIDAEGNPHAHRFQHGNGIRVELTNIDVTNRELLGSYPFVVPMMSHASAAIFADAGHQSYIELPMIGTPTGVENGPRALPVSTALYQNYPNPFNPTTVIRYNLAVGQDNISSYNVSLKIYDLLGREVATLVDEKKVSGEYTISFDGSKLAGGVYFYRLEAGRAVETRKMLLIR